MADININSLTQVTTIDEDKNFLVFANESTNAGSVMTISDFKEQIIPSRYGASAHNLYRGKNLGTSFTETQSTAIKNGTFDDLYVGDYWIINETTWRIAGVDLAYNCGDRTMDTHHLVVLPDAQLSRGVMNETNVTTGGYIGSYGRTTGLTEAVNQFVAAFGDEHILTYRDYMSNAVTNGQSSAAEWVDARVELMNEVMIYGSVIGGPTQFDVGIFCFQFPLFAQCPELIHIKQNIWLRSVAGAIYFANVGNYGIASANAAASLRGFRPFALLS